MSDTILVKAEVIARRYSVTPQHIYNMAKQGKIPSERIGNAVRFDADAVDAAIKGSPKEKAAGN